MSETELLLNRLSIKLLCDGYNREFLGNEFINNILGALKSRYGKLNINSIEAEDMTLIDSMTSKFGGISSIIEVDKMINCLDVLRDEKGSSSRDGMYLWMSVNALKEFRKRMERVIIPEVSSKLFIAFERNIDKEISMEDFIRECLKPSIYSHSQLNTNETFGKQIGFFEEENCEDKSENIILSNVKASIEKRKLSIKYLYNDLIELGQLKDFKTFCLKLVNELKMIKTVESFALSRLISVLLKELIIYERAVPLKKDDSIKGQLKLESVRK